MREMKDSGIEWIGKIPVNWQAIPLKWIVKFGKGLPITKDNLIEQGVPVVNYGQIHSKSNNGTHLQAELIRFVSETYFESNPLSLGKEGDIFFADTSEDYAGIGNAVLIDTDTPVFAGYHTVIVRPDNQAYSRYLAYLFLTDVWRSQLCSRASGIKVFSITQGLLKKTTVILPPAEKVVKMTDYLDRKCSQIDSIIAKQQEVIEKLKEYKLSVITEAVTKGLNPDVPMKDSGIEWIGKIPEHWNIIKLARIINSTQNGLTRRNLDKSDGQIVLKLKNISANGEISYEYQNRIELTEKELNTYSLSDGDFLFVRVNGSKSLVGKCAVFHSIGETVAYNDHIIRVKISNYCIERFLLYYLLSSSGKTEIDLHTSTAAGQYTISGEGLRDVYLTLPLKDEQKQIVNYLDNKCEQIDFTITKKQKLIEKLTDYKKSLVYEVVTGKKEV